MQVELKFIHFIVCCIRTIWLCFWSSHVDNQIKCQLGDYGEEPRWWLWFTKHIFIHNYQLTMCSSKVVKVITGDIYRHDPNCFFWNQRLEHNYCTSVNCNWLVISNTNHIFTGTAENDFLCFLQQQQVLFQTDHSTSTLFLDYCHLESH